MTKIYLDLDNVLVDFNKGLEAFNLKNDTTFIHKPRSEWTALQIKLDREVVDCMNTEGFFLNLPPMPGYWDLWRAAGSWPFILTAAPKTCKDPERVGIEKKMWCDKYLGPLPPNRFIYCEREEKKDYASTFRSRYEQDQNILVDDMENNCKEWEDAGGLAIQYRNHTQAVSDLRKALKLVNG